MENREIKFRVWDKSHKLFIPTDLWAVVTTDFKAFGIMLKDWDNYIEGEYFYENSQVLMQYTGLKDKNGKDIYECDVIKDCLTTATMQIIFGHNKNNSFNGWYCRYINLEVRDVAINGDYDTNKNSQIEIIGNIYENPDLLQF